MRTPLLIHGAGGLAREIAWLAEGCNREHAFHGERLTDFGTEIGSAPPDGPWTVVGFVSDVLAEQGTVLHGKPVMNMIEARSLAAKTGARIVVGVGEPIHRERIADRLAEAGFELTSIRHPGVLWSHSSRCGTNTVIQVGSLITVDVHIGDHVLINGDLTIGHDTVVGDGSVVCPGANLSGWVRIGRRVLVGTGATILAGNREKPLTIGDDAVIGAGACVVEDVAAATTVVGVPARPVVVTR